MKMLNHPNTPSHLQLNNNLMTSDYSSSKHFHSPIIHFPMTSRTDSNPKNFSSLNYNSNREIVSTASRLNFIINQGTPTEDTHKKTSLSQADNPNPFYKNPSRFSGLKSIATQQRENSLETKIGIKASFSFMENKGEIINTVKTPKQSKYGEDSNKIRKIIDNANQIDQRRSSELKTKYRRNKSLGQLESFGCLNQDSICSPALKMMVIDSLSGTSYKELNESSKCSAIMNLNSLLEKARPESNTEYIRSPKIKCTIDKNKWDSLNNNSNKKKEAPSVILAANKETSGGETEFLTSNQNLINLGTNPFEMTVKEESVIIDSNSKMRDFFSSGFEFERKRAQTFDFQRNPEATIAEQDEDTNENVLEDEEGNQDENSQKPTADSGQFSLNNLIKQEEVSCSFNPGQKNTKKLPNETFLKKKPPLAATLIKEPPPAEPIKTESNSEKESQDYTRRRLLSHFDKVEQEVNTHEEANITEKYRQEFTNWDLLNKDWIHSKPMEIMRYNSEAEKNPVGDFKPLNFKADLMPKNKEVKLKTTSTEREGFREQGLDKNNVIQRLLLTNDNPWSLVEGNLPPKLTSRPAEQITQNESSSVPTSDCFLTPLQTARKQEEFDSLSYLSAKGKEESASKVMNFLQQARPSGNTIILKLHSPLRISKIKEIAELGEIISPQSLDKNEILFKPQKESLSENPTSSKKHRSLSEVDGRKLQNSSQRAKQEGIVAKKTSAYFGNQDGDRNTASPLKRDITRTLEENFISEGDETIHPPLQIKKKLVDEISDEEQLNMGSRVNELIDSVALEKEDKMLRSPEEFLGGRNEYLSEYMNKDKQSNFSQIASSRRSCERRLVENSEVLKKQKYSQFQLMNTVSSSRNTLSSYRSPKSSQFQIGGLLRNNKTETFKKAQEKKQQETVTPSRVKNISQQIPGKIKISSLEQMQIMAHFMKLNTQKMLDKSKKDEKALKQRDLNKESGKTVDEKEALSTKKVIPSFNTQRMCDDIMQNKHRRAQSGTFSLNKSPFKENINVKLMTKPEDLEELIRNYLRPDMHHGLKVVSKNGNLSNEANKSQKEFLKDKSLSRFQN